MSHKALIEIYKRTDEIYGNLAVLMDEYGEKSKKNSIKGIAFGAALIVVRHFHKQIFDLKKLIYQHGLEAENQAKK